MATHIPQNLGGDPSKENNHYLFYIALFVIALGVCATACFFSAQLYIEGILLFLFCSTIFAIFVVLGIWYVFFDDKTIHTIQGKAIDRKQQYIFHNNSGSFFILSNHTYYVRYYIKISTYSKFIQVNHHAYATIEQDDIVTVQLSKKRNIAIDLTINEDREIKSIPIEQVRKEARDNQLNKTAMLVGVTLAIPSLLIGVFIFFAVIYFILSLIFGF